VHRVLAALHRVCRVRALGVALIPACAAVRWWAVCALVFALNMVWSLSLTSLTTGIDTVWPTL